MSRKLQGSAGPGGTTDMQWQDVLLRYGASIYRLPPRDGIAELTRQLANTIVDWMDICALIV